MAPVEFVTTLPADEGVWHPPALRMQQEDAQQLIDALWDAGLRPTEGSGSAGALAATQRHLEDMRSLVFKQPKPQATNR